MDIADLVGKGLPAFAVEEMAARGITTLEPLQRQAVEGGLFDGRNMVVMAPTSCGKTLVAELAALYHAVHRQGTVIVTSLKALAYEKYLTFRESYSRPDNFLLHTGIATGDEVNDESATGAVSLTVATYEKWYYMLIDQTQLISRKSLLVVDELQMLGDPHRGGVLEALLTWTKLQSPGTQIIGLSATFPNAEEVSQWLGAEIVSVEKRPIPLIEQIWSERGLFEVNRDSGKGLQQIDNKPRPTDTLEAADRIKEEDGLPAVVFCVTKDKAENLTEKAGKKRERRPGCESLVNDLDEVSESDPTIRILRQTLPKGVAFHNANLVHDERRLIEGAFRKQNLDLLFATPTLSAGVNLPIKTVIFDDCYRNWVPEHISTTEYLNMAGRAGRRGLQEKGRSVLLARTGTDLERFKLYLGGLPEPVKSQLAGENLDKFVLQAVASRIARSELDIKAFFDGSFHRHMASGKKAISEEEINACLKRLVGDKVVFVKGTGEVGPTALGARVAVSGILPRTGRLLFDGLSVASKTFEWDRREIIEKRVLLLATACPEFSPSIDENALLRVHRKDDSAKIQEVIPEFLGLAKGKDLEDPNRSVLSALICKR